MKLIKSTTKNINFVKDLESHDELIFSGDVGNLFEKLKSKKLFDLVVTSPPYNIGKEYENAHINFGLSIDNLLDITRTAINAAFIKDDEKKRLQAKVDSWKKSG